MGSPVPVPVPGLLAALGVVGLEGVRALDGGLGTEEEGVRGRMRCGVMGLRMSSGESMSRTERLPMDARGVNGVPVWPGPTIARRVATLAEAGVGVGRLEPPLEAREETFWRRSAVQSWILDAMPRGGGLDWAEEGVVGGARE